ncbi:uncharacterized protein LOC105424485 [Pogonomyrmex barbatus]|uniref:Uncharacterized protein LOC105424485 n=1 Tax=Pogonomyrmex barbatus TaxID=144034 RepID=A0A6I9W3K4_9HYME|nr:uncharacterized protein LOC105424485 [Pogonomyrmex barbatus]
MKIYLVGVTHFEELGYLFYPHILKNLELPITNPDSKDYKMMNYLTQLWTDFAKTGNPTPTNLSSIKWIPLKDENIYNYLNIDIEPRMETFLKGKQRWDWEYMKDNNQ